MRADEAVLVVERPEPASDLVVGLLGPGREFLEREPVAVQEKPVLPLEYLEARQRRAVTPRGQ